MGVRPARCQHLIASRVCPCASGAPLAAQKSPPVRSERRSQVSHDVPYCPTIAAPSTPGTLVKRPPVKEPPVKEPPVKQPTVKVPPQGPGKAQGVYTAQSPVRFPLKYPPPRPSRSLSVPKAPDVNPWETLTTEAGHSGVKGGHSRRSPYADNRPRPADDRKGGKGWVAWPWRGGDYPDYRESHPDWDPDWTSRQWRPDTPSSSSQPDREWTVAEWDAYIESFQ